MSGGQIRQRDPLEHRSHVGAKRDHTSWTARRRRCSPASPAARPALRRRTMTACSTPRSHAGEVIVGPSSFVGTKLCVSSTSATRTASASKNSRPARQEAARRAARRHRPMSRSSRHGPGRCAVTMQVQPRPPALWQRRLRSPTGRSAVRSGTEGPRLGATRSRGTRTRRRRRLAGRWPPLLCRRSLTVRAWRS